MTSSYGEIVERLEKLTAPSRDLDCDIDTLINAWSRHVLLPSTPHYTASIDAAVALVEKMLPGWGWLVGYDDDLPTAKLGRYGPHWDVQAVGSTPAIALLIALFRALTVNENG